MLGFYDFFAAVRDARFGFPELSAAVSELYSAVAENPDLTFIWDAAVGFLNPVLFTVPYIIIVFLGFTAFFGRKMLPVLKIMTFSFFGFVLGAHFIPPLFAESVDIPGWICGLCVGLLAAVLYRFIYVVLYATAGLYCTYVISYNAFFINKAVTEYSLDKVIVSLVIAVAAVTLAFIFKKYAEMAGTALLSGYLVALTFKGMIFDYSAPEALGGYGWIITLTVALAIAIPGAYVQFRKREKY